ncbi:MAG: hypothetical protein EHM58_13745 [Ignavibacteriae bacterium]|nr:MAG: hypothetical protein EHM58_13745 [Ignavibacteriota bacterium]
MAFIGNGHIFPKRCSKKFKPPSPSEAFRRGDGGEVFRSGVTKEIFYIQKKYLIFCWRILIIKEFVLFIAVPKPHPHLLS